MIARTRSRRPDRKSTRLNSSHGYISTLSLHDALPIWGLDPRADLGLGNDDGGAAGDAHRDAGGVVGVDDPGDRGAVGPRDHGRLVEVRDLLVREHDRPHQVPAP